MITVEVTCRLARPAVLDGPIHLDAILTARHPAMHDRSRRLTRSCQEGLAVAPLPLAVARKGDVWVWCASAHAPIPDGFIAIVKRRDGVDYHMTNKTVYPSVGPERDRLVRKPTINGPIVFRAAVPDEAGIKELRRLLRRVEQVGGLLKSGYGVVHEWLVSEIDAPPETCLVDGDFTRRVLPEAMLASCTTPERMSILPPYWQQAETHLAYPVGIRGALCSEITITSPNMRP